MQELELILTLAAGLGVALILGYVTQRIGLSPIVGYLVAGVPGFWGGLLGVGIAVAFFTLTVVVALVTARFHPTLLGIVVMVSWLVKMGLLVVILVFLRSADFYSRPVFFLSLLVCTFGYLGMEAWIVNRTKVLYLETEFAPTTPRA